MSTVQHDTGNHEVAFNKTINQKLHRLTPAVAAIVYPFLLDEFHRAVSSTGAPISAARFVEAALCLLAAAAVPLIALFTAFRTSRGQPSKFDLRARRLAYLIIGVPPAFVLLGVSRGLLHIHANEKLIWVVGWLVATAYVLLVRDSRLPPSTLSVIKWRVAHGVAAAALVFFILFHLINHFTGLRGAETHAAVMKFGRQVYRSSFGEPVLISLMLFQVISGARLAWRWSSLSSDGYRVFQIGSGVYLGAFVLTHLNSALISARTVHHIDTNWAWASAAPIGLIHDSWSIRLLPHYAFGVFFILGHLASGLRGVVLAHGGNKAIADRVWTVALVASAFVSIAIISGLCGLRI
jgi:hypothetical protein